MTDAEPPENESIPTAEITQTTLLQLALMYIHPEVDIDIDNVIKNHLFTNRSTDSYLLQELIPQSKSFSIISFNMTQP